MGELLEFPLGRRVPRRKEAREPTLRELLGVLMSKVPLPTEGPPKEQQPYLMILCIRKHSADGKIRLEYEGTTTEDLKMGLSCDVVVEAITKLISQNLAPMSSKVDGGGDAPDAG